MSQLSLKNPLLTLEQIRCSPSEKRGLSRELEANMRAYGCHLIESAGIILGVPQVVMASAQILFQRFYYLGSFQDFSLRSTVLGSIFLACKAEESIQNIRNIINAVDIVIKRDRGYPEIVCDGYDSYYYEMKNEMVISEMHILRKLAFNVQVELPYGLLVNYLQSLNLANHTTIPQFSWNCLNDLLRTPIYLCFQPETIACGAIFYSALLNDVGLPLDPPWWEVFDANEEDVLTVACAIKSLYSNEISKIVPVDHDELKLCLDGRLDAFIDETRARMHLDADRLSGDPSETETNKQMADTDTNAPIQKQTHRDSRYDRYDRYEERNKRHYSESRPKSRPGSGHRKAYKRSESRSTSPSRHSHNRHRSQRSHRYNENARDHDHDRRNRHHR